MTKTPAVQLNIRPASDEDRAEKKVARASFDEFLASLTPKTDLRAAIDDFVARTPIADGLDVIRVDDADLHGWWLRPAQPASGRTILFLHGGGYAVGSATGYRGFASQLASRTGLAAFVLDYPLAPEEPFPAAYDATLRALHGLARQGHDDIAIVGDSAGAGLALALLGEPALAGVTIGAIVAFSPWTDLAVTGGSVIEPGGEDPMITVDGLFDAAARYLAGADPKDGRASPLYRIPEKLPPIYIQVGAHERLLDDARRYATLAGERGGIVRLDIWEDMSHVFQFDYTITRNARRAFDDAAHFLISHWAKA